MFETYTAAQYRALDDAAFEQRKSEVIDLMNADTLPEGVTDDMLFAEADLIEADVKRRNAYVALRNAKVASVVKEAKVVETSAPQKRESGFKAVSEGTFTNSREYRQALAKSIATRSAMPADMLAKARQERAAGDPIAVSFADGYTNMTDPTFSNLGTSDFPAYAPIPLELSQEIVRVRKEYGQIHPLVRETRYQGGVAIPIADLTVDYHWINDKHVSPYQYDEDPEVIAFTWKQLEARFARTFLVEALMQDNFKELLAPALAEGYGRAMDEAILNGNGTTQPLGLLKDPRFMDQTTGAGTGKATVVEATADELSDWSWWVKLLYNPAFNRLYRTDGTWLIGDATWGTYIETLKDEVNRPLAKIDPLNDEAPLRIRGNRVVTLPNNLLGDFDSADTGDVVAIFGNMRNYCLNFQPGLPLNTITWDDHETNTRKTKVLTAVDGRLVDNNGWVVITKGAGA